MLESLPIAVLIATVLGFLSGLGIGGGSLLMIWLTVALNKDPATARCINLLFFIPSALVACIIRNRNGELDLRSPIPAILSGCICAAFGSFLGANMDTQLIKKFFGAILLAAGAKELFYLPRKAR